MRQTFRIAADGHSSCSWKTDGWSRTRNIVERSIRPISIGKKNSLFCGDEGGGETWAILATLLNTAKSHGVDPETYLADVLERMVSGATKNHQLHELLVWNWKAAREAERTAA